jgi:hypothetical protein
LPPPDPGRIEGIAAPGSGNTLTLRQRLLRHPVDMDVTAASAATNAAAGSSTPAIARAVTAFTGALTEQQRRLAAADVLTSMPPMVADQIRRSEPGGKSPMSAIDELFKAIKSGDFKPTSEQLAAHDCVIATTARAAGHLRIARGDVEHDAQDAGRPPAATGFRPVRRRGAAPDGAGRHGLHAQGGDRDPRRADPGSRLNWWETAIRFLVDGARATALASANAVVHH